MRAALVAASLCLVGTLAVTIFLSRTGNAALDRTLEQRLRGAGESAALLLGAPQPASRRLADFIRVNDLDDAYVLSDDLQVVEDASGDVPRRADLLRVDAERVRRARAGEVTIAPGYALDDLRVTTAYFPLRGARAVLALEAGQAFASAHRAIQRARVVGLVLSLLTALALGAAAARWMSAENARRAAAERAARGDVMARMAAMAAHEIRNPLGVIRGTVELLCERTAGTLSARDQAALSDVLDEVERLRALTDDFLDLGRERPFARERIQLPPVLDECCGAIEKRFPGTRVRRELSPLPPVEGDAARLRQLFGNLLVNAAEAQGGGDIVLDAQPVASGIRVRVIDSGPGIPEEVKKRLFDPFVSGKQGGTGLGLAIVQRIARRHGGSVHLVEQGKGAIFEVFLPAAA
jgi:two-component system OmpR family sensor kinase